MNSTTNRPNNPVGDNTEQHSPPQARNVSSIMGDSQKRFNEQPRNPTPTGDAGGGVASPSKSSLTTFDPFDCNIPDNETPKAIMYMKEAAKKYASIGWHVIPLHVPLFDENGKLCGCTCEHDIRTGYDGKREPKPNYECPTPGKHPMISNWEERATAFDKDQVFKWWGRRWSLFKDRDGNPVAVIPNIGIATGPSGLIALDRDDYKDNYKGDDLQLTDETVTSISGSGGSHEYYKATPEDGLGNHNNTLPNGLDARGWGGLVVAAPSIHPSGNRYQWELDLSPFDIDPAPIPEKLRTLLLEAKKNSAKAANASFSDDPIPDIDIDDIDVPALAYSLIVDGHTPGEDRSNEDFHVVCELVKAGLTDDEIRGVFSKYPVGEKYLESGDHYLARTIGNARAKEGQSQAVSLNDLIDDLAKAATDKNAAKQWAVDNVKALASLSDSDLLTAFIRLQSEGVSQTFLDRDLKRLIRKEIDANNAPPQPKPIANGKPTIITNNRQLADMVDEFIDVLADKNKGNIHPYCFIREGITSRVISNENEHVAIQPMQKESMVSLMGRLSNWVIEGKKGNKSVNPPPTVAGAILADANVSTFFPPLISLSTCPVLTDDGLHTDYGYDEKSRIFNTWSGNAGDIDPTAENIAWAKGMIFDNLLVDFPFDSDASKAHAFCLMIQPFVRYCIPGPTPNYDIEAPTAGTGKGKLARACCHPALGVGLSSTTYPANEDEMRKTLVSLLLEGATHIFFDNIPTNIDVNSAVYASALTEPILSERILGVSQNAKLPITQTWVTAANNPTVSDEIARRWVRIRIDANTERPQNRDGFKHDPLEEWYEENRTELVRAILILLMKWDSEGRPAYSGKHKKGSYEAWVKVMGGILECIGIDGFLENEHKMLESADAETAPLKAFIYEWFIHAGTAPKQPQHLFFLASYLDGMEYDESADLYHKMVADPTSIQGARIPCPMTKPHHNLLADLINAPREQGRKTQLGSILKNNKEKVISGFRIMLDDSTTRRKFSLLIANPDEAKAAITLYMKATGRSIDETYDAIEKIDVAAIDV